MGEKPRGVKDRKMKGQIAPFRVGKDLLPIRKFLFEKYGITGADLFRMGIARELLEWKEIGGFDEVEFRTVRKPAHISGRPYLPTGRNSYTPPNIPPEVREEIETLCRRWKLQRGPFLRSAFLKEVLRTYKRLSAVEEEKHETVEALCDRILNRSGNGVRSSSEHDESLEARSAGGGDETNMGHAQVNDKSNPENDS